MQQQSRTVHFYNKCETDIAKQILFKLRKHFKVVLAWHPIPSPLFWAPEINSITIISQPSRIHHSNVYHFAPRAFPLSLSLSLSVLSYCMIQHKEEATRAPLPTAPLLGLLPFANDMACWCWLCCCCFVKAMGSGRLTDTLTGVA
jgi:hypothetical protein